MNILLLGLSILKEGFQELGHHVLTCTTDNTGDVYVQELPIDIDRLLQVLPNGWSPDFVLLLRRSLNSAYIR